MLNMLSLRGLEQLTSWFVAKIAACLLILLMAFPTWAGSTEVIAAQMAVNNTPVDIEVFVRQGCPHCEQAEIFLKSLGQQRPELRIVIQDISQDAAALDRLKSLAEKLNNATVRVPAFYLHGQLIVGYSDELTTGQLILNQLDAAKQTSSSKDDFGSCEAVKVETCEAGATTDIPNTETFELNFLGYRLSLDNIGLPLFTIAMGLLDGFNPCSIWVLILMISLLAPMQNRMRMLAVAGAFVAVEGIAYFVFMAAWLNLFLFIGLSRVSEIIIAVIAILVGLINLKDFWAFGWGVSLSIPEAAKPGIYSRIRKILQAQSLWAAMLGAVILAVLVQIVELLCTSGFPALFTRILTLKQLNSFSYYGYLLLYNAAYMLDDLIILSVGVITLSQHRLQEKQGRWLKLISGLVMVGLGIYLLL